MLGAFALMALFALFPYSGAHAETENGSGVQVNIGAKGDTLVRGAKVTAVSGARIDANTSYGSSLLSWVVKTDSDTDFKARGGGDADLADIAVGDVISFSGGLDQTVAGLTVSADVVKDWTRAESKKAYSGIVTSINATLDSFTLAHGDATTTVETSSTTRFRLMGANASFENLFLNAKVKVQGMLDASGILDAVSVNIASSSADHEGRGHGWGWLRGGFWLHLFHR